MRVIQERASRARVLLWHTQSAGRTLALTRDALPPETANEHRVFFKGSRSIDQRVQDLVVASRRHVERFANGTFFRAALLPPAALEGKDLTLAFGELQRGLRLFHVSSLADRAILP